MDYIGRLVRLGIFPDCARITVKWFESRGDIEGLERYIENIRTRQVEASER